MRITLSCLESRSLSMTLSLRLTMYSRESRVYDEECA